MQRKMTAILLLFSMSIMQHCLAAGAGEQAPALALPALRGGETVSLSDYAGKVVYLDFWASWCPPCLVSMPIMNEIRNRLQSEGADFEIVAVNVDSDPEDALDFLADRPVDFVVLSDPGGTTPALYELQSMPTSFLINAEGKVVLRHEGFKRSDAKMLEAEIRKLLE